MCGIVGYSSTALYDENLKSSMVAMAYRGPDSSGNRTIESNGRHIGLGHVRLKIIDLDDRASQPFVTKSGNSLIIFNGEIYNFMSLREKLPDHEWSTTSDTEVVAELLEKFGSDIVKTFNGIFAIARVCLLTGNLTLFRDTLGVKPLYYTILENELFFASEIKALAHFPIDTSLSACDIYESLNFGYVHEPNTGFEKIKKVAPGTILTFGRELISNESFGYELKTETLSEESISQALDRQTVSDVPIGTFFSGGLDSGVIASQVKCDLLYINGQAGVEDDEQRSAKRLAEVFQRNLSISVLPMRNDFNETVNIIDSIVRGVEEPISDLTYLVSKDLAIEAKKKGFTVMLSGMGADELFGGYLRYYFVKYSWFFNPLFHCFMFAARFKKALSTTHKIDRIRNYISESAPLKKYARLVSYFSNTEIKTAMGEKYVEYDDKVFSRLNNNIPLNLRNNRLKSIRFLEMKGFLAHNLTVADKSSMQSSIELRVPLLDLELVGSWFGRHYEKKGLSNLGKKPLIRLLNKYVRFKWSPFLKSGFNPSINKFLQSIGHKNIEKLIINQEMLKFFDKKGLQSVLNNCFHSSNNVNYHKVWQLMFLSRWVHCWSSS